MNPADPAGVCLTDFRLRRRPGSAFTLLEMLVVIAIIGVLAALLLPSLAASQETGRAAACRSDLHQIGIGLQIYVQDNGNHMPVLYDQSSNAALQTNSFAVNYVLSNSIGAQRVFRCPSDNAGIFQATGSSYAWNSLVNGQDADHVQVFTYSGQAKIPIVYDKQSFHSLLGPKRAVNYLYADGHIKNLLVVPGSK